jgi:hypothetical protein
VSIIPGIDAGAPDRTETSSGFSPSPNTLPVALSRRARCASTSSGSPAGYFPVREYFAQTAVEITNPGGTGTPIDVIWTRP